MPNVKELRKKHPDWQWTSVQSGPANNWRYEGQRGDERIEICGFNEPKRWYVYWKAPSLMLRARYAAWSRREQAKRLMG